MRRDTPAPRDAFAQVVAETARRALPCPICGLLNHGRPQPKAIR